MGNVTSCAKVRPVEDRGTMPFWKKDNNSKSKEKVNYKARFEHKQYLVRTEVSEKYRSILSINSCLLALNRTINSDSLTGSGVPRAHL